MKHAFDFDSLKSIDHGSIREAVNRELLSGFKDSEDRPELAKPRVMTLKISQTPVMKDGVFRFAKVSFEVEGKCPKRTLEVLMTADHDGLEFSAESLDNPEHKTLDFETEPEGQVK